MNRSDCATAEPNELVVPRVEQRATRRARSRLLLDGCTASRRFERRRARGGISICSTTIAVPAVGSFISWRRPAFLPSTQPSQHPKPRRLIAPAPISLNRLPTCSRSKVVVAEAEARADEMRRALRQSCRRRRRWAVRSARARYHTPSIAARAIALVKGGCALMGRMPVGPMRPFCP